MNSQVFKFTLVLLATVILVPSASAQLDNFYERGNKTRIWDINVHNLTYSVADNASPGHTGSVPGIFVRVRLDHTGKGEKHVIYQNDLFEDGLAVIVGGLINKNGFGGDAGPVTNFLLGDYTKTWNLNDDDRLCISAGFNLADRFFYVGERDTSWQGLYGYGISVGPAFQCDYAINKKLAVRLMAYGSQVVIRDSKYKDERIEKRVKPLILGISPEILSSTGFYLGYDLRKPLYSSDIPAISRSALRFGFRF